MAGRGWARVYRHVAAPRAHLLLLAGLLTLVPGAARAQTGAISGAVTDAATGAGLGSVSVFVHNSAGAFQAVVTTVAGTGVYTASGLPAGTYFVRTSVPSTLNYIDEAYNNVVCVPNCTGTLTSTTPVAVNAGATTTGINFGLSVGGIITGSVTNANTGAGITAIVRAHVSNATTKEAVTSATGAYSIVGLPTGTYYATTAVTTASNFVNEAWNNIPCLTCDPTTTTPISVTAGTTTSGINFGLLPGGTLSGRVTSAATGLGLSNVVVSAYTSTGLGISTRLAFSSSTGNYSISGLLPGSYFVRTTSVPGNLVPEAFNNFPCRPCDVTTTTPVSVSVGVTTGGVDFALSPGATITGTVTDVTTGLARSNVVVQVYSSSGELAFGVATNASGVYAVQGLPGGIYFARTSFGGSYLAELYNNRACPYLACAVTSGTPIAVAAQGTASGIDFGLRPAGFGDLVVNFGPAYGLWMLTSGSFWVQLHGVSPVASVVGDLDGNGQDDLIVNFGDGYGVWAWMNHVAWVAIHPLSPTQMVTGDLDGNGRDEALFVFPGYGLWRLSEGGWVNLHPLDASRLAVGQLDGVLGEELLVDFPGYGLWVIDNYAAWRSLHPLDVSRLLTADLDGNGREEVIVDFPGFGLWAFANNSVWSLIHALSPTHVVAGHLDTNAQGDLVIDFGAGVGLWMLRNGALWAPLHGLSANALLLVDRDANGRDEIVVDFGPSVGLWQFANDSAWGPLHGLDTRGLTAGQLH